MLATKQIVVLLRQCQSGGDPNRLVMATPASTGYHLLYYGSSDKWVDVDR